jgi:hypothetical protein
MIGLASDSMLTSKGFEVAGPTIRLSGRAFGNGFEFGIGSRSLLLCGSAALRLCGSAAFRLCTGLCICLSNSGLYHRTLAVASA